MLFSVVPRRRAVYFTMLFVSAVCLGQNADNNPRVNDDNLKGIRAALERLVQLTQDLNKTQKANFALQQIQLYEFRLQALETQNDALAERENELSARNASLERAAKDTVSGLGPTGLPGSSAEAGIRRETVAELDASQRSLDTTRAKKQQIEREIVGLRAHIESLQKALAAADVEK